MISVIISAYNEAPRIGAVVAEALPYVNEVLVVDDGSTDVTGMVAERAGARVIQQENAGYIAAIKRGFREARGDIVITMDADGEHRAADIPRLVRPLLEDEADLVLGVRSRIARPSERFLNWLTNFKVKVRDSGTGFRALRRDLALQLKLEGRCICSISVLESAALGARIHEVQIDIDYPEKKRKCAWLGIPPKSCTT